MCGLMGGWIQLESDIWKGVIDGWKDPTGSSDDSNQQSEKDLAFALQRNLISNY